MVFEGIQRWNNEGRERRNLKRRADKNLVHEFCILDPLQGHPYYPDDKKLPFYWDFSMLKHLSIIQE
mgnify:CR=1 FL=1